MRTFKDSSDAQSGTGTLNGGKTRRPRAAPVLPTQVRRLTSYAGLIAYTGNSIPAGTLRRLVSTKSIPHIRTGPRSVAFDLDAIDAWIAAHTEAA